MAKKSGLGKLLILCTAVGAAAAGAYLYLAKRDERIAEGFDDDDFDDFDDFDDDDFDSSSDIKFGSRKYVDIKTGETASEDPEKDDDEDEDDEDEDEDSDLEGAEDEDLEEDSQTPDKSEEFFDDEK